MTVFFLALYTGIFLICRKGYCDRSHTIQYALMNTYLVSVSVSLLQPFIVHYLPPPNHETLQCPNLIIYNQWYTGAADNLANVTYLTFGAYFIGKMRVALGNARHLKTRSMMHQESKSRHFDEQGKGLYWLGEKIFIILYVLMVSLFLIS